jgi:hypothetical protein
MDYIHDVVGNPRGFNPVSHYDLDAWLGQLLPYQDQDGFITPLNAPLSFPLADNANFTSFPFVPIVTDATLSGWSVDAFNAFHDQVPTEISLPNFLYELREMKSMIPSIDRSSLTKTASNNFLALEFGIKPFISDIKAILTLSEKVDKRLSFLLASNAKSRGLSFKRTQLYPEPYSFERSTTAAGTTTNGFMVTFQRQSARVDFTVTGKLYQDLQDLAGHLGKLRALTAASGFNKPARVVWNAIPYSFVVDWFFHVGKLLDSLSIQPFGGEYTVSNMGYSLKAEATYLCWQDFAKAYPANKQLLGTISYKGYERHFGLPVSSLFATDASLTPKQLALSLAMLEQKRR